MPETVCLDVGGNHLNYDVVAHAFSCGNSSSGGGGGDSAFSSILTGINNNAIMTCATGCSILFTSGGIIQASEMATTGLSGYLQAAQFPALTGDCTTSAGALAITCGVLRAAQFPALTGDCTTVQGALAITCTKNNGTAFGTFATQNYATPPAIGGSTPAAGTFTLLTATDYASPIEVATTGALGLGNVTHGAGVQVADCGGNCVNVITLSGANLHNTPTITQTGAGGAQTDLPFTIQSPSAAGSSGLNGGLMSVIAGAGDGAGSGGGANLTAGVSGATGTGGLVKVTGGAAGASSGNGGGVNVTGGAASANTSGVGGVVQIIGGAGGSSTGNGGAVTIHGGLTVGSTNGPVNICLNFNCASNIGTGTTTSPQNIGGGNDAININGSSVSITGPTSITGHSYYAGSSPVVSACGTSPSIDTHSTDSSGTVTVGTVAAASCTVTFNVAYTTFVHCRVTAQSFTTAFGYSYTKTAITVTATSLIGEVFDYTCDGS